MENVKLVGDFTPNIAKYELRQAWECNLLKKQNKTKNSWVLLGDKGISNIEVADIMCSATTGVPTHQLYIILKWEMM